MANIHEIIKGKQAGEVISKLKQLDEYDYNEPGLYREEYEGERTRRAGSVGLRENKIVGSGDSKKTIITAKLVFDFPKKIVNTATAFLFGGKMNVSGEDTEGFEFFDSIWNRLKMKSKLKQFARTVMIETRAALVFYVYKSDNEIKMRAKILDCKEGAFFPHFNEFGDMDAFVWERNVRKSDGDNARKTEIFTAEYRYVAFDNGEFEQIPELFGKIPVVYAEQDTPEWENIAGLMDKLEMRISRLSDTNDYFSEPLLKLFGEVKNLPDKGSIGKVVQFTEEETPSGKTQKADAEYLTWDQMPENIKTEYEVLKEAIHNFTSTPDLSFSNMKGIGALSGTAIQLMFMDAFIKRADKQEIFDVVIERCINVVKAGIANIMNVRLKSIMNEEYTVEFGSILPTDLKEQIEALASGTTKDIISQQTAAEQHPMAESDEYDRLKKEGESNLMNDFNE